MDGYQVQQPFADLIANGQKTWDLRTSPVSLPSRPFYILATRRPHPSVGSYDVGRLGVAVGIGKSRGVLGPFAISELEDHFEKHRIAKELLEAYAGGRKLFAMVIEAEPIPPRRYRSKQGAVNMIVAVDFED